MTAATPTAASRAYPLVPSRTLYDLGTCQQAGLRREAFQLTNRSAAPMEIYRFSTSCPCLDVELFDRLVQPGQTVTGRILIDMSREPDHTGGLLMDVEGLTLDKQTVCAFQVRVRVVASPRGANGRYR